MVKANRKRIKDLENWLADFRKLAGQDIIVNILVTNREISFISCYVNEEAEAKEPEPEHPNKPLFDVKRLGYFG